VKTRAEKVAEAQRLRQQGLKMREIAERIGVTPSCIWKWLNPERTREFHASPKERARRRRWEEDSRELCPECGSEMAIGSRLPSRRSERCASCRSDAARARTVRFIRLREDGLNNREIAEREGVSTAAVAQSLCRADRYGLRVPVSPYFKAAA
jgi:transposase